MKMGTIVVALLASCLQGDEFRAKSEGLIITLK